MSNQSADKVIALKPEFASLPGLQQRLAVRARDLLNLLGDEKLELLSRQDRDVLLCLVTHQGQANAASFQNMMAIERRAMLTVCKVKLAVVVRDGVLKFGATTKRTKAASAPAFLGPQHNPRRGRA
jgi:hypothetical protein